MANRSKTRKTPVRTTNKTEILRPAFFVSVAHKAAKGHTCAANDLTITSAHLFNTMMVVEDVVEMIENGRVTNKDLANILLKVRNRVEDAMFRVQETRDKAEELSGDCAADLDLGKNA